MVGRFFALELGCPEGEQAPDGKIQTVAYLNDDGSLTPTPGGKPITYDEGSWGQNPETQDQESDLGPDGPAMICECRGLGCDKCKKKRKRKPAQVFTLTGPSTPTVPVMNLAAPFQPSMIMLARRNLF